MSLLCHIVGREKQTPIVETNKHSPISSLNIDFDTICDDLLLPFHVDKMFLDI